MKFEVGDLLEYRSIAGQCVEWHGIIEEFCTRNNEKYAKIRWYPAIGNPGLRAPRHTLLHELNSLKYWRIK